MAQNDIEKRLGELSDEELHLMRWRLQWKRQARPKQLPPDNEDWTYYGYLAGRGAGKTRSAANWLGLYAATNKNVICHVVAPTHDDVRFTCFQGPTGLLSVIPPQLIKEQNLSLPSITLWNDSFIRGFAADTPERLRGPQCYAAWCLVGTTRVLMADGTELPISQVKPGDMVQTRYGPSRVNRAGLSGRGKAVSRLTIGDYVLTGTPDHKILTDNGWKELRHVSPCDSIYTWKTNRRSLLDRLGILNGAESNGIGQRPATIRTGLVACFMSLFGRTRTNRRSQKNTSFTTSMKTLQTIVWKIFSACFCPIMSLTTSSAAQNITGTRSRRTVRTFYGQHDSQLIASAKNAERHSNPQECDPSIVTQIATQLLTGASVESAGEQAVYDLSVDAHEFIANNVIVHNCDEVASWRYPKDAWDNLVMGHRLGSHPKLMWTGTPKPIPFMKELKKLPKSIIVVESTFANRANLPEKFFDSLKKYEGTAIGRQELYAEILDPEDSGFVKRSQWNLWPHDKPLPKFIFVMMSLDTAFTEATFNKREQTGDPTACQVWGLFEYQKDKHTAPKLSVMLLDAWEEHMGLPELVERVKRERKASYGAAEYFSDNQGPMFGRPLIGDQTQRNGRKIDLTLIEDKGSGISLRQVLAAQDILTYTYNPGRMDKLARLHAITPMFAQDRVWAVESANRPGEPRSWAETAISQVCSYTGKGSLEHDDALDVVTQSLKYIADRFMDGGASMPAKGSEDYDRPGMRGMERAQNYYDV